MTPESQRIAIAEACGWKVAREFINVHGEKTVDWFKPGIAAHGIDELPDYLSDLNAMHSAVQSQDTGFQKHFNQNLITIANQRDGLVCNLTAKDWAGAFLNVYESRKSISS